MLFPVNAYRTQDNDSGEQNIETSSGEVSAGLVAEDGSVAVSDVSGASINGIIHASRSRITFPSVLLFITRCLIVHSPSSFNGDVHAFNR